MSQESGTPSDLSAMHCSKRVFSGVRADFDGHMCTRPVRLVVDGKPYCAIHEPNAAAAREKKLQDKRAAQRATDAAKWKRHEERNKMADDYPRLQAELAAAQRALIRCQNELRDIAKAIDDVVIGKDENIPAVRAIRTISECCKQALAETQAAEGDKHA